MTCDATAGIQISGLTMRYGSVLALDNLELTLPPGQVVGLLGENGCGKTTLMKILAGVETTYTGRVEIAGHPPGPVSKGLVSYLPDTSCLPAGASIAHCLRIYRDFFPDFDENQARRLLEHFGLPSSLRLKHASKGMQEKAQVALAMSRRAQVFLLDEPISGVDPAAREIVLEAILANLYPDSLVFISTHLVHDLESVLDAVVIMRHGRVLLSGNVDDLRAEHGASVDHIFRKVHS